MVEAKYWGVVLGAPRLGKRFRGGGRVPLMSFFGRSLGCRVVGISINRGFSGPIMEREVLVENKRGWRWMEAFA